MMTWERARSRKVAPGLPQLKLPGPVPSVLPDLKERHHHGPHFEGRATGAPGLAIPERRGGKARGGQHGRKDERKAASTVATANEQEGAQEARYKARQSGRRSSPGGKGRSDGR